MQPKFELSSMIPAGLVIEGVTPDVGIIVITAKAISLTALCPLCESPSRRVHSRYVRRVSDLPCAGRGIRLHLAARRFRCDQPLCRQRIFAERYGQGVVAARSRRTARLDCIVHHLGIALGGRPGANFAKRLMLPVSNDTLLRMVRRRSQRPAEPLKVVGIDDWAFHRNHRYGSIVCDLERRRIVTLGDLQKPRDFIPSMISWGSSGWRLGDAGPGWVLRY